MTYHSSIKTISHQPGTKDDPGPKSEAKTEKIPEVETLVVPAALLLACEAISPQKDVGRAHLQGVYLTARDGSGHAVATDGCRMFIGTFPLPKGTVPNWLKGGVIVSNDGLKARASLLLKLEDSTDIVLSYAKGAPFMDMSDKDRHANFRMNIVSGQFPDYEAVLANVQSFGVLDDDGQVTAKEWQTVGINSKYLKSCGEIAKLLENGLPKEKRPASGMVVRAFNAGSPKAPLVFDFSSWPGALLVVHVVPITGAMSNETAALLGPAAKLTVAALRAHATRWIQRADEAGGEADKEAAMAKAAEFQGRVAAILKLVPGLPAIEAAKAQTAETETVTGEQPATGAAAGPAVKRTKVRTKRG